MKENEFNQKLGKALRAHFHPRGGKVYKHNDFYTTGVPDFSVSWRGLTTWLECKVLPNRLTALQAEDLRRLAPRAFLVEMRYEDRAARYNLIAARGPMSAADAWDLSFEELVQEIIRRCTS